jgi:chaperonin cofactor prefoldin
MSQQQISALNAQIGSIDREISSLGSQIQQTQNQLNALIGNLNQRISNLQTQRQSLQQQIVNLQNTIVDPNPPPQSISPFAQSVLDTHNLMMEYFNIGLSGTSENNNFVIPFIPANYNLKLDSSPGLNSASQCALSNLGADNIGSLTFLEIFGNFTASSNLSLISQGATAQQIVALGRYIVRRIRLPAHSIGQSQRIIYINNGVLSSLIGSLDSVAFNNLFKTVTALSAWAQRTAFLTYPPLCLNYYYSTYDNGIMSPGTMIQANSRKNLSVSQTPTESSRVPNLMLANSLQKAYYDRLYDFMMTNNYIRGASSRNLVVNLLKTFRVTNW